MLRVIRIQDVCDKIALSRTSLWRLCKTTDFPRPIQLGGRVAGFLDVVSQHVVPLEAKASSGRPVLNSGVRSMEVVMMHPGRQFVSAML